MRFKGFWKEYWDICKQSGKWMKKYWLPYTLLCIVIFIVSFFGSWIAMFGWSETKALFKKRTDEDKELDEFLK